MHENYKGVLKDIDYAYCNVGLYYIIFCRNNPCYHRFYWNVRIRRLDCRTFIYPGRNHPWLHNINIK